MALGLFNELRAGEVDPYYQILDGRTLVAHVVPRARGIRPHEHRELWVITYQKYPWNDILAYYDAGFSVNLHFKAMGTPGGDHPPLEEILKEKFPTYDKNNPDPQHLYTHVTYPLSEGIIVHDGLQPAGTG